MSYDDPQAQAILNIKSAIGRLSLDSQDGLDESLSELEQAIRFLTGDEVPDVYPPDYLEAARISGAGVYVVTHTPQDYNLRPCWIGFAHNPVDALSRFTKADGFSGYDLPELRNEIAPYSDDNGEPAGAYAVFTNTTIYSLMIHAPEVLTPEA